eukprot:5882696-Amphidinium_carterae.1
MHANNAITKKPMTADATLMNPKENIIALKACMNAMHSLSWADLQAGDWSWLVPFCVLLMMGCAQMR